jgi:hypothetical protein
MSVKDHQPQVAAPMRGVMLVAVLAVLAGVLAIPGIAPVRDALSMWELGTRANAYWVPGHATLLYLTAPLATLAAAVMFMTPGLALAATFGRPKGAAFWLVSGLAWSVLVITLITTAVQKASGVVLTGPAFGVLIAALSLGCLGLMTIRMSQGKRLMLQIGADRADLAIGVALFLACLILLSPKFYWENFTGDGSGSLQFARLFIHTLWPFWPADAGAIADAPGLSMVLFVIPESWFVRLWGESEFAVRAPYLMYLAMVYPVVAGLIRWAGAGVKDRPISPLDHLLIAGALGIYTMTIIYSGGYNPYFGDSPMPAARETLSIAMFLGYVLAYAQDRLAMMVMLGLMASVTIPTGGLWLGLVTLAGWLVWSPRDVRRTRGSLMVVVLAVAVSVAVPAIIGMLHLPYPGEGEFGIKAIINRLRYVALTDWERFLFLIVPCGTVPAAMLLTWRRQDALSRLLTLATAAFFLFFYLQGYRVLLHHFAPIMLAPVVVLWRSPLVREGALALPMRVATALGLAASLWLVWPAEMKVHGFDRQIGDFIEVTGDRFDTAPRGPGDRFRGFSIQAINTAHELLGQLFPIGYTDQAAKDRFYGAPLVWWFYSEFPKADGQAINYRIKPVIDAAPSDGTLLAEHDGYGLYIADQALYDAQRATRLPTDTGAAIFVVSRDQMFGKGAQSGDRLVIDFVAVARGILGL